MCGPMHLPNQGTCQSRKTAEKSVERGGSVEFPTQGLARFPKLRSGTFAARGASSLRLEKRSERMLGKLAAAWLGDKVAGPNRGAKGAIIGYGAAALARRSVPALAALALGGWALRKLRARNRSAPSYPSEATPSSPSA